MTMKKSLYFASYTLILIFISGCASNSYNMATRQKEFIMYSTEKEVKLGSRLARKLEDKYELFDDEAEQERINEIGRKIAAVSDRQDLKYHFKIIKDKEVNALALPGGYIYVSHGLIEAAETDDEIAAVLAHEVGHIAAQHSMKKMQGSFFYTFMKVLTLTTKTGPGFQSGTDFAYISVMMQYSRAYEEEADRLSVKYLKAAGFNPEGALMMLDKLSKIDSEKPLNRYTYFRTHPPIARRKAVIKQAITKELDYKSYINLLEEH